MDAVMTRLRMATRTMSERTRETNRRHWITAAGLLILSALVVVWMAFRDTVTVENRADLRDASFGWPPSWLNQDLRILDPPFPWDVAPVRPQETTTSMALGAFAIDTLLVFSALAVVVALVVVLSRRMSGGKKPDRSERSSARH